MSTFISINRSIYSILFAYIVPISIYLISHCFLGLVCAVYKIQKKEIIVRTFHHFYKVNRHLHSFPFLDIAILFFLLLLFLLSFHLDIHFCLTYWLQLCGCRVHLQHRARWRCCVSGSEMSWQHFLDSISNDHALLCIGCRWHSRFLPLQPIL